METKQKTKVPSMPKTQTTSTKPDILYKIQPKVEVSLRHYLTNGIDKYVSKDGTCAYHMNNYHGGDYLYIYDTISKTHRSISIAPASYQRAS